MKEEQRTIGEYTVRDSFSIGEYEIVLCENANAPKEREFLCGFVENNGIYERLYDCMVSDSYADIATVFGERIAEKAEEVQKEQEHVLRNVGDDRVFTAEDCEPVSHEDRIEDRIIVLRDDLLRPEYKHGSSQLFLCTGGFGAQGNPRGRTCFLTRLYDARQMQCRREDILGVMPEEQLPVWAKNGLAAIRQQSTELYRKSEERGDR